MKLTEGYSGAERVIRFFWEVKKEFSEWQKEGKLNDFAYLFSIDVEFKDDLNNGIISEKLKNIFKTEGFSISENVNVTKDKGDNWVITDGGENYIVKEEDGKLNIYDFAKPVAKGSAEIALKDILPSVRKIIKNVIDKSFPDEKEELLKDLKEFSENQLEKVSSKIDVSVENLRLIKEETRSTFEEIPSEVKETKSEVNGTKGRYSRFRIVDEDVEPALGVDVIADELSKLLINMENEKGMMVGIFGRWGRGKTFLMDKIWVKLEDKSLFNRVDFQAWKYQDTPASWAYLYEEFANGYYDKPKNMFSLSWFSYWEKIVWLNFKRKGLLPIISVLGGISISLSLLLLLFGYLITNGSDTTTSITPIIGIFVTLLGSVVGIWKYLKKEYGSKAIELFKEYSEKQSFKQFLGIQAEIQKELKILLEAWIPNSKEDFEKPPKTSENTTKVYKEESVTRSKSKSSKKKSHLFSWDNGRVKHSKKLKKYLMDDLDIGWAKKAKISESTDGKTISISKDKNSAEIKIDEKKEKATLKIGDGKTYDLKVKNENGKLNIYKKSKRILLFVDDIDRCSEERIIQIIDSLRVMLEADGIYQRIIVISAIDEDVFKRAIKWKYSSFFNDDKETFMTHRDTHKHEKIFPYRNKKKSEKLDKLVKEYMDKLFLIGIKLEQLTDDEKKEIFDIYTKSRDIVAPNQEDRPLKKETTTETDSREVTQNKSVEEDEPKEEPKEESNEKEQRGDNLGVKEEENKYELSHEEYELLLGHISFLEDATPREVRIFYYRYLLARNLLEIRLRGTKLERIWSRETDKSAIPRLILNESNPTKKLFSFNENNPEILEELTKIIKMVVAY